MKIGNLLLIITGVLTIASLFILTLLVMNYMEHTTLFHQMILTFTCSAISCISLYAIKKEN